MNSAKFALPIKNKNESIVEYFQRMQNLTRQFCCVSCGNWSVCMHIVEGNEICEMCIYHFVRFPDQAKELSPKPEFISKTSPHESLHIPIST